MPVLHLLFVGMLFSVLVIALRFLWVYPTAYLSRRLFPMPSRTGDDPVPPARHLFLVAFTGMLLMMARGPKTGMNALAVWGVAMLIGALGLLMAFMTQAPVGR